MRTIRYEYDSFLLGCGCCSDSTSICEIYEDAKLVSEFDINYCENEQELRQALSSLNLEPFEVDPDSRWF
jgi:hypothetical protein